MNVLLIGSAGREEAISYAIANSSGLTKLYVLPGNFVMSKIAHCLLDVDHMDPFAVAKVCKDYEIDLVIIGPEGSLAKGIGDIVGQMGIQVVGPGMRGALLENSKIFGKELANRIGVPTSKYASGVNLQDLDAIDFSGWNWPVFMKRESPYALGKGVKKAHNKGELRAHVEECIELGCPFIIEEGLDGREVSLFALCNGEEAVFLATATDHKAVMDGNKGPNTGGMGCVSPSPWINQAQIDQAMSEIVLPTLKEMSGRGICYSGIMFLGLMMTSDGMKLLEYNSRFGDPETLTILMRLAPEADFLEVLWKTATNRLSEIDTSKLFQGCSASIVAATKGYPGPAVEDGAQEIIDINIDMPLPRDTKLFFYAGVMQGYHPSQLCTKHGRVLAASGKAPTTRMAIARAYDAISHVRFPGMHYRKDIGK